MNNKKVYFWVLLSLCAISFLLGFITFGKDVIGFKFSDLETIKLTSVKVYCCIAAIAIPVLALVVYTIIRSVQNSSGFFEWCVVFIPVAIFVGTFSFVLYLLAIFGMGCLTIFPEGSSGSGSGSGSDSGRYCALTGSSGCC